MFNKSQAKTAFKSYRILSRRQRVHFIGFILIYVFTSFVQVAGLGAVLPFLNLMLEPDSIDKYAFLLPVKSYLGWSSAHFALLVGAVALALFLFGMTLKVLAGYWRLMYVQHCQITLAGELMTDFLRSSYLEYLKYSTAEIAQRLGGNLATFVNDYLKGWLTMIGQSIVLVIVAGAVIYVSPFLALCFAIVLALLYGFTYVLIRPKLRWIGAERWKANLERGQVVNEVVWGFKEVKVLNRVRLQENRFFKAQERMLRVVSKKYIYSSVPPVTIQAVSTIVLFVYLGGSVFLGNTFASNFAIIGFFVLASRQIIPAANGVFRSIQSIKMSQEIADKYIELFYRMRKCGPGESAKMLGFQDEKVTGSSDGLAFERSVIFDAVSFSYPGRDQAGVFGVNLEILKNTSTAFVGSTGAGKSTLADLLLGLIVPEEGSILVDGVLIADDSVSAWQRHIGYVPQAIFLSQASVRENIALGLPRSEINDELIEAAARSAQIHDFVVSELPDGYETKIGERGMRISGGQRQRIGIARALYHQPDVMIFDEATSALDNETEAAVMESIDAMAGNKTVILIAHRLSTVQHCDQIVVLDKGEMVQRGNFDELSRDPGVFRDMLSGSA